MMLANKIAPCDEKETIFILGVIIQVEVYLSLLSGRYIVPTCLTTRTAQ